MEKWQKWQVSLNNDSFDRAGITKDCKDAVCEYIWNGFEAGASKVSVSLQGTPLKEPLSLVISDNDSGISYDKLSETFGAFLLSIKNHATIRIKSQANKGKGRFSYLSFSHAAEWQTTYRSGDMLKQYSIRTDSSDRSKFNTTEPQMATSKETGTVVIFPLLDANSGDQLSYANMRQKLLEEFAWFLYLNKEKAYTLEYMGTVLDISQYINTDLSKSISLRISNHDFAISIIVWKSNVANSSKIYYLTEKGEIAATQNTSFNKNKVNFYHAVFVSSAYFKPNMFLPTDEDGDQIELEADAQSEQKTIIRHLRKEIWALVSEVLKSFLSEQADAKLADMEKRGVFPAFSSDEYGQLRKRDFQTVTKELYCVEPRIFYKLNDKQEKSLLGFLNLLLSSEERENVLQIIEQVVSLTTEQRKNFAEVLQRSQLQYIVEAISVIEKRVSVIEELKQIVFAYSTFANERDHIQKLIEQHFWLFGEQYHMLTADKNMRVSLREFERITAQPSTDDTLSISDSEALQRMDIFLYSQQVLNNSSSEMLIIELKAPRVKLSIDVFNQIVRYANTIRKEPRFIGSNRVWKFYAVCAEVEDDVKIKYKNFEQHGKIGLADIVGNFELYALSWDDIFQAFEARHSFLLSKLKLDYSQISTELGITGNNPTSKEDVTEITQKLLTLKAQ